MLKPAILREVVTAIKESVRARLYLYRLGIDLPLFTAQFPMPWTSSSS